MNKLDFQAERYDEFFAKPGSSSDSPRQVQCQASKLPEMSPHPGSRYVCHASFCFRHRHKSNALARNKDSWSEACPFDQDGVMEGWNLDLYSVQDVADCFSHDGLLGVCLGRKIVHLGIVPGPLLTRRRRHARQVCGIPHRLEG